MEGRGGGRCDDGIETVSSLSEIPIHVWVQEEEVHVKRKGRMTMHAVCQSCSVSLQSSTPTVS